MVNTITLLHYFSISLNIYLCFTNHVLVPFRTYSPVLASYTALVSIPAGSEPWLGSVKPNAPISSPLAGMRWQIGGEYGTINDETEYHHNKSPSSFASISVLILDP